MSLKSYKWVFPINISKKLLKCRRLETESYFEKIAFLLSAVRRRYGRIYNPILFVRTMQRRHLRERLCRSDTSETKTLQKRAFPCAAVGTYSPLRFLHALQKASTHLFPTPSPPLSPLLQFVFNCFVCLLYWILFRAFHRRPTHLWSSVYISSICCLFCLALRLGLAILSVIR